MHTETGAENVEKSQAMEAQKNLIRKLYLKILRKDERKFAMKIPKVLSVKAIFPTRKIRNAFASNRPQIRFLKILRDCHISSEEKNVSGNGGHPAKKTKVYEPRPLTPDDDDL